MRAKMQAFVVMAGLSLAGASAVPAAPAGNAVQDRVSLEQLVEPVQFRGGYYCERLRLACVYKEYRDEVGEGNCRRYRRECGRDSYCERLRRACISKEARGEVGEGNCRRYRRECGRY